MSALEWDISSLLVIWTRWDKKKMGGGEGGGGGTSNGRGELEGQKEIRGM
jgi:hypothetical protein